MAPAGVWSANEEPSSPSSSISRATHPELRPRVAAARTAVVAEMADVGGGELVRPAAADAMARVGGVLERGSRLAWIVEAERDRVLAQVREIADLRIVAVHDQRRAVAQIGDGRPPALGNELELAVAVELVAKEVAEQKGPRTDTAGDLRQGTFVHLEQAELGIARREERRGHARDEIGSRVVPREPSVAEDLSHHRRGRRLAVRRGNERHARRQARREGVDRSSDRASTGACRGASCRHRSARAARGAPLPSQRASRRPSGRSRTRAYLAATYPSIE